MDYEDLIATILAGVIVLVGIGMLVYIFIKYGTKQIEIDYNCRKAQLHFYESASKLIDKDLKEDGNELSNQEERTL